MKLILIGFLAATLAGCGVAIAETSTEVVTVQDEFDAMDKNHALNVEYWNKTTGANLTIDDMVGNRQAEELILSGKVSEVHFVENGRAKSVSLSEVSGYKDWQETVESVYLAYETLPETGPIRDQIVRRGEAQLNQDFEGMEFLSHLESHAAFLSGTTLYFANALVQ